MKYLKERLYNFASGYSDVFLGVSILILIIVALRNNIESSTIA